MNKQLARGKTMNNDRENDRKTESKREERKEMKLIKSTKKRRHDTNTQC